MVSVVRADSLVSISADGNLHFAALLGLTKAYGTEPFVGEVPKIISDLIQRITLHE